jgi:DNA-binding IclR family transcriptional regulator
MAFWNKKKDDFEEMDVVIQDKPGISASGLARMLGVNRSTITRRLPSMEEAGYLYYEDDEGGLWPFRQRR